MYKKALILSVILVLATASLALAGPPPFTPWKCLVYDGVVWIPENFTVLEDTSVFVTNPNSVTVKVWMRIFNKDGKEVWQGPLLDHFEPLLDVPPMGFVWMPLGFALSGAGITTVGREKLTYQIVMSKPKVTKPEPRLKCVVEVKQVIYAERVHPLKMLGEAEIRDWCEAAPERWTKCPTLKGGE